MPSEEWTAGGPGRRQLQRGYRLGRYEIARLLGHGGMGAVYLARDLRLGRAVALKILHSQTPAARSQFEREAVCTAQCAGDRVVGFHDLVELDGNLVMVLEFVPGQPLDWILARHRAMPALTAITIGSGILRALTRVHARGYVHCDIKPSNIIVGSACSVRLIDFGIARSLRRHAPLEAPQSAPLDQSQEATEAEHASGVPPSGTMAYMAPEQWGAAEPIDHRADLWAFGLVFLEMLTGTPTCSAKLRASPRRVHTLIALAADLDSAASRLPAPLRQFIKTCLIVSKEHRASSAEALLRTIGSIRPVLASDHWSSSVATGA